MDWERTGKSFTAVQSHKTKTSGGRAHRLGASKMIAMPVSVRQLGSPSLLQVSICWAAVGLDHRQLNGPTNGTSMHWIDLARMDRATQGGRPASALRVLASLPQFAWPSHGPSRCAVLCWVPGACMRSFQRASWLKTCHSITHTLNNFPSGFTPRPDPTTPPQSSV